MGRFDALLHPPLQVKPPSNPPVAIPQKPENLKSGNPATLKTAIPDTLKAGKPESSLSRKQGNLKARLPENQKTEKYSTQLDPSLIKQIKQCALENDVKDYEIVQIAIQEYLAKKK